MREELIGNSMRGFSTLELVIAMALICIALVGAVDANFSTGYWVATSETADIALAKSVTAYENLHAVASVNFTDASSSPLLPDTDPECLAGSLCYFTQNVVTDFSNCSKSATHTISWRVGRYPTSTTSFFTYLTSPEEAVQEGGDCVLFEPEGNWASTAPQTVGSLTFTPGKQITGIDVFHKKIYVVSSTSPFLTIYNIPSTIGQPPTLAGSSTVTNIRLNAIDVVEDFVSGRTYAFVAKHSTSSQLAVLDVTDPSNVTKVAEGGLRGITGIGTFSEGWHVRAYGNRLYVTTRETAGNEFHIFDISDPRAPNEIGNGFQVNRTINDFVVRDQQLQGNLERLVFLAADSNNKEVAILKVTNDLPSEIATNNLPGNTDGLSVFLLGNKLYLGRATNSSGPELYAFDISRPTSSLTILKEGEVGAAINSIYASGRFLYLGTGRINEEFQVWNANQIAWNSGVLNAGRFTFSTIPSLTPLGIDVEKNWVYVGSQKNSSDQLKVLYTP